jgi:ATP-binding cassette, subfamily B, bacterial MsbA
MFGSRRNRRSTHAREEDVGITPDTPVRFRRLLAYLKPYRGHLVIAVLALILSALLSLVFPIVIQSVIDSVLAQRNVHLLDQITLALLLVFGLRSVTSLIENYKMNYIGERITLDLRLQLYRHLLYLSLVFYERRRVGELVSRLSSDVTMMRQALTNNVGVFLQQTLILVGSVGVMLALNWRLTLFILAVTPVVIGIGAVFGRLLRRTSTQVQDELASSTVIVDEVFQNIRVVKSFVREPFENERYTDAVMRAFRAAIRVLRIRAIFGPLVAFLGFGSLALILWYGGREVLDGRLTGGALIAFLV